MRLLTRNDRVRLQRENIYDVELDPGGKHWVKSPEPWLKFLFTAISHL